MKNLYMSCSTNILLDLKVIYNFPLSTDSSNFDCNVRLCLIILKND